MNSLPRTNWIQNVQLEITKRMGAYMQATCTVEQLMVLSHHIPSPVRLFSVQAPYAARTGRNEYWCLKHFTCPRRFGTAPARVSCGQRAEPVPSYSIFAAIKRAEKGRFDKLPLIGIFGKQTNTHTYTYNNNINNKNGSYIRQPTMVE